MRIIFDVENEVKNIEKIGISITEKNSGALLTLLMHTYLYVDNFNIPDAISKVKKVAKSYFKNMPKCEVDTILTEIANAECCGVVKSYLVNRDFPIQIYESEWRELMSVSNDAEQLLLYYALIVSKYIGRSVNGSVITNYKWISASEKEIFDIVPFDKKNVSGRKRQELWNSLYSQGKVDFKVDFSQEYPRILMTIPFNADVFKNDEDKILFNITHYDDLKIYLDFYGKKKMRRSRMIKHCEQCGKLFYAGQKRFCPTCAELRKRGKVEKVA